MNPDEGVVVRTFANTIEADLAGSWLDAAGIDFMVMSDDAGGAYPFLQMTRGVKLIVAKADEARAQEVLETAERGEEG